MRLLGLCLAAGLSVVSAAPAMAEGAAKASPTAGKSTAKGAALLKSAGLDQPLEDVAENIRAQIRDTRVGHSPEAIAYATQAFDARVLLGRVAADLEAGVSPETLGAADAFFTSPVGANLRGWTNRHHALLKSANGKSIEKILADGLTLLADEARGPLFRQLHVDSGRQTLEAGLLRATNHAWTAAEGKLDDLSGPAVDAKLEIEFPKAMREMVLEFDLPSFAYGYRFASAEELEAYRAFVTSKQGAAFIAAAQKAIDLRLREAGDEMVSRLKEKKS